MKILDSRRLTGPSLLLDRPGAILDVALEESEVESAVAAWREEAQALLDEVGWRGERLAVRFSSRGAFSASLALSAPIDALYAATELNEAAWAAAASRLAGAPPFDLPDRQQVITELRAAIAGEANPPLVALRDAAHAHGVAFLADAERASVGLGRGAQSWPIDALPAPGEVDWPRVHDVPVALVTGTNGKTTTIRMLAAIVAAAGKVAGSTTTDRVMVGSEVLARGDYSGPTGARLALRDPRVDVALLETARGGILRRGLAVERADAAAVTNVADDHLGEFGVEDLAGLAITKLVVARAVRPGGWTVLNADDPELARHGSALQGTVAWFSLDAAHPLLARRLAAGGAALWLQGDDLVLGRGARRERLAAIAGIPAAYGGAARHNLANALAALGVAAALGLPLPALRRGLAELPSDAEHNPGRGNLIRLADVDVLLDYAHNPHGLAALRGLVAALPAKRRSLLLGHAGDRSDDAVRALAGAAWELRPDHVVVKEMPELLRGRQPGVVPALLREELRRLGARSLDEAPSELAGVRQALASAQAGDLLIFLVHSQREAVLDLLRRLAAAGWQAGQPLPP
jgi:UDP-N-acetylmuramyl tripeptide synthase